MAFKKVLFGKNCKVKTWGLFNINNNKIDTAEYLESEDYPEIKVTDSMAIYDPRFKFLGGRIICPKDSLEIKIGNYKLQQTNEDWHIMRTLYGIPEVTLL